MCIIIIEALRVIADFEGYLVLAGVVIKAYQAGNGDSYGVASLALLRGRS